MRGVSSLIRLKVSFSAATARSGFELFGEGELVISGQDVVAVVYGENITKGSPVVVKIDFDPTKLADPATLPTNTGRGCAFDPTGNYLAVAHDSIPYITIYKRSGDTFTKLADPAALPSGAGYGCAFDPTGTYLAVAHDSSPYITIYKRDGDTFTKLADPAALPTNTGYGCAFDPTGTYLAVAHFGSPYIAIYRRSGDTFTKLADPATRPPSTGYGCAFDPTGTYLAVAHGGSPRITIYNRSSRTVFKTGNSLLDIQAGDVVAAGYAREDGLTGETKEIVRIWKLGV